MSDNELSYYIDLLRQGELVAFPTETVYGLGADAQNPEAVRKIFKRKERPADNPLIVHVSDQQMAGRYALKITREAQLLMDRFWPGPLTLILPKNEAVLDLVTGGLDTVALRMPSNDTALALIRAVGALAAPSANKSGRPSPTTPSHVKKDFGADFPVAGRQPTEIGIESTVLDLSEKPYRILRPGAISAEEIEKLLNSPLDQNETSSDSSYRSKRSPGNKYTHYSPKADVRWLDPDTRTVQTNTLYLLHSGTHPLSSEKHSASTSLIIDYKEDYNRLGRELYDRFRQADLEEISIIAVEPFDTEVFDQEPFTIALQNRISKAIGN